MGESGDISPFTKQEIQNMKFPTKLWLLTNTPNRVFKWSTDGSGVLINFVALDDYLCSTGSIFKTKSRATFIRELVSHGFQKHASGQVNEGAAKGSDVCHEYKHENFQQGRTDLLPKVLKRPGCRKQPVNLSEIQQKLIKHPNRQHDPCCSIIKALSNVEKARLNLRIILQVQAENYILHKKLSECEQKSPSSSVSVIELPAEAFENPYESISRFEENPEYAGFYGHATTEQVKQFFDEYLPIYAQANGDDTVEKSLGDNVSQNEETSEIPNTSTSVPYMDSSDSLRLPSEDSASCPSNFQIKYSVSLDSNENKEYTLNILEETCSQVVPGLGDGHENATSSGLNTISSLEPIFSNCDEEIDVNSKEEDISMDQYLKFRHSSPKSGEEIKDAAEHIKAEKTEDEDDQKAENGNKPNGVDDSSENFKNFFNQYRESMNLLYD